MRKIQPINRKHDPTGRIQQLIERVELLSHIKGKDGTVVKFLPTGITIKSQPPLKVILQEASEARSRRAITTEASSARSYIFCNLYDSQGIEILLGVGSNIAVHCSIIGDVNMNSAIPMFPASKDLYVAQVPVSSGGSVIQQWHCLTVLQGLDTRQLDTSATSGLLVTKLYECADSA